MCSAVLPMPRELQLFTIVSMGYKVEMLEFVFTWVVQPPSDVHRLQIHTE